MTDSRCVLCPSQRPRPAEIGDVCGRCRDSLDDALADIGRLYATLPGLLPPSQGSQDGGGGKRTKVDAAPLPLRGDVLNLLGPAAEVHGADVACQGGPLPTLVILESWERMIREERQLPAPDPLDKLRPWLAWQLYWVRQHAGYPLLSLYLRWLTANIRGLPELREPSVASVCRFLRKHLDWVCHQGWVPDFAGEIRDAHAVLKTVCGEHRPHPIGACPECETTLYASTYSDTVTCRDCGADWNRDRWRLLGQAMGVIAG